MPEPFPLTFISLQDREHLPQTPTLAVIAAIDREYDVMAQAQDAFDNFIESGQVWALLIGVFIGYIFRSFTSY